MTDALLAAAHRSAIEQQLYRLARSMDRLDAEAMRPLFAKDAHVQLGVFHDGAAEAFIEVAMGFMSSMERTQHSLSNILIELAGERAAAESHVFAHHVVRPEGGEPRELVVGARYLTKFALEGGVWLITHHAEIMDWAAERALGDWFDKNEELPKGQRGSGDPSYAMFASLKRDG